MKNGYSHLVFLFYCCLCVLLVDVVQAQTATVRGFVTDQSNGETLRDVNVIVEADGQMAGGTATDSDGFYSISRLVAGQYIVRASFIGYHVFVDTLQIAAGEVQNLDIVLQPSEEALDEVIVGADRPAGITNLRAGLQTVQPADIEAVPSLDATGDLAMYLTTLPGVVSTADQGGQFFIRGGEPWHNLVLLDGMLIYQPFHILGFYSAFPSDILSNVDLYAGGYGAKYGGRLSSVIDVSTRNGNNQHYAGSVALSPFVVAGRAEGPIDEAKKLSFLASFRQSVIEQGASQIVDADVPYMFNDFFGKIHGVLRRNGRFSITGLRTYDRGTIGQDIGVTPLSEQRWWNEALGARYLFIPGSLPVLADFNVSVSRLRSELGPSNEPIRFSSIGRLNVSGDITHYGWIVDVKWGLFARTLEIDNKLGGAFQDLHLDREFVTEAGLYLGTEFKPTPQWRISPSLRVHSFPSKNRTFLEPRIRAVWQRGIHQVSGAGGVYHQEVVGLNDRRDATSVFTAWTASPFRDVSRAIHAILGYSLRPGLGLEFSAETYYKKLSNLNIAEWTAFPRLTTKLQPADGRVIGLDLRVELRLGQFYGNVSYGLSSVEYTAKQASLELWFGTNAFTFRPAHDRRHQVNMLASGKLVGLDLSARWQFGSGLPFNRALGFDGYILMDRAVDVFETEGDRRVIYERPFNGILPSYHRLDISVAKTFSRRQADFTVQASILNVYDRANIFYLDVFTLRRADQLPFMPSFGLKVELN